MDNDVYYRIYESNGKLTVVCMQWFDEYDYDEDRFMVNHLGYRLKFDYEDEAIDWLNSNVKPELIDEEYLRQVRAPKYNREYWLK